MDSKNLSAKDKWHKCANCLYLMLPEEVANDIIEIVNDLLEEENPHKERGYQEKGDKKEMFHVHTWKEVKREFTPPTHNSRSLTIEQASSTNDCDKFLFGFTTIELKCSYCNELEHRTVIGRI